ncbi:patatin-like phospholipase family protein [Paucibacter sp. DJ1R-11]|uniref:patatin-like phospholipase family protein n=1 Tax=Paucibacter sp. DJ1R-11 TaxID=2893556 RepID=UPI0021E3D001|nr:patatin-like phospholipase family protein [Paucibacter sp. DJ1R-11]MCV2362286.1 patatin-like phospholipase family protein [Paucibacter sp. DJ1R-11]
MSSPAPTIAPAASCASQSASRHKLGLALAGGGFRASLFHVGVLRRLAELDLLRYVEVLSTVSGGSVVGALYLMHLKAELEQPMLANLPARQAGLSRAEYLQLVLRVEQDMRRAAQRNLRTRLLMHPFKLAWVVLGPSSLATAMAKVYERELLAGAVQRVRARGYLDPAPPVVSLAWWQVLKRARSTFRSLWLQMRASVARAVGQLPGDPDVGISIRALRLRAPASARAGGSENYNHQALWAPSPWRPPGSALTRLIINATSLNSGARFWFSHAELGEWYVGHLRYEEIGDQLLKRKRLLYPDDPDLPQPTLQPGDRAWADAVLACWGQGDVAPLSGLVPALSWCLQGRGHDAPAQTLALVQAFSDAEAGRLRLLKTAAWFLTVGAKREPRVDDGLSREQHRERFWEALAGLDQELGARVRVALVGRGNEFSQRPLQTMALEQLCRLVLEVYKLRGAWMVSPRAESEWDALPLAQAVTASAAFPPVFPPYLLSDFYDDRRVRTLGLTDGGVFDNMGTMALLDEQCNLIIASDPGGIFETEQQEASVGRLGLSARLTAILSELPLNLFRHELRERQRLSERLSLEWLSPQAQEFLNMRALKAVINFRIESGVPGQRGRQMMEETAHAGRSPEAEQTLPPATRLRLADERERRLLARLRTDLDAFSDLEAEALIRQGYLQAEENLGPLRQVGSPLAHHPGWTHGPSAPYEPPFADPAAMRRRERLLRAGHHRFLRLLALWGPVGRQAVLSLLALAVIFGLSREGQGPWLLRALLTGLPNAWSLASPSLVHVLFHGAWSWVSWGFVVLGCAVLVAVRRRLVDRARRREFGLPPPEPLPLKWLQLWWRRKTPTQRRTLGYYRNAWVFAALLALLPMNWVPWVFGLTVTLIFSLSALACLADACLSKPLLRMARRGTGVQGIPDSYPQN